MFPNFWKLSVPFLCCTTALFATSSRRKLHGDPPSFWDVHNTSQTAKLCSRVHMSRETPHMCRPDWGMWEMAYKITMSVYVQGIPAHVMQGSTRTHILLACMCRRKNTMHRCRHTAGLSHVRPVTHLHMNRIFEDGSTEEETLPRLK